MRLQVYQRNDLTLEIAVTDETGAALDLTGAALTFDVGAGRIVKTVGDGITITDPVEGRIEVALTNNETDLPRGNYRLELLVTDAFGHRYTAAVGTLVVHYSQVE